MPSGRRPGLHSRHRNSSFGVDGDGCVLVRCLAAYTHRLHVECKDAVHHRDDVDALKVGNARATAPGALAASATVATHTYLSRPLQDWVATVT